MQMLIFLPSSLQAAPKDKLLVYNVKDGWEPLCKFLNLPIPDEEFPHKNKNGSITKEYLDTIPKFRQMRNEAMVSLAFIIASLGFAIYNIATNPIDESILGLPCKLFNTAAEYFGFPKIF